MQYPDSLYYQGKSYKLDEIRPLPELVEKAVRGIGGWQVVRHSQNPTADRARFVES